jgi:diguanylate cyclase (GGDEF)-like protein
MAACAPTIRTLVRAKARQALGPVRELPWSAVVAFLAAYLVWQLGGWGGESERTVVGDVAIVPPTVFAAVWCWRAAARCGTVPRLRWGWRLVALGIGGYAVGEVVQLVYELRFDDFPFPSLADPAYLIFYPLVLAGLLCFSGGLGGSRSLRTALDSATVALGGAAVIWYVSAAPTAAAADGDWLGTAVSIAYPVGDLVLIVALARILAEPRLAGRRPLRLLAAGLAIFVVADVAYTRLVLDGAYSGGHWVDTLWVVAMIVFAIAAASQAAPPARGAARTETAFRGEPGLLALAPYAGTAAVFAVLIAANRGDEFFPNIGLVLAAGVMGAFVSLRQMLAQRDLRAAHRELAKLASTDPLTGLSNQRTLVAAIDAELERCRRRHGSCALLFLDLDHFKAINDGFGHAAGDDALRELGRTVATALRTGDTLGRWGGEEFVVLLPDVDGSAALEIAERIRATVAAHPFGAIPWPLTVSIGAAVHPEEGETRRELLVAADRALYAAKRSGRDCVRGAGAGLEEPAALHAGAARF